MGKIICKDVDISVDGIGLVIYSNGAMQYVVEGSDFFAEEFSTPDKVARHIEKGDIVGFNTGTGGKYKIRVREGYPDKEVSDANPISIRLAIDVKGNKVSIIDLYWLMEWSDYVPEEQQIEVEEGIYHLTILTSKPESKIWGDNQEIYLYMSQVNEMPILGWNGVPRLFY